MFSHKDIARLAFASLERPTRIHTIPDGIRRFLLRALPYTTPRRVHGPGSFFLTAMGLDMVGKPYGTRRLVDFYKDSVHMQNAR